MAITKYTPSPVPGDTPEGLKAYINTELRRIADAFPIIPVIPTLHAAPARIEEGMLVIADGTDWNPGSGAGTYIYRSGSWRKLD